MILEQYNSKFASYEITPRIYTTNDISNAVYTMGDREGALQIEYDNLIMRIRRFLQGFGYIFGVC